VGKIKLYHEIRSQIAINVYENLRPARSACRINSKLASSCEGGCTDECESLVSCDTCVSVNCRNIDLVVLRDKEINNCIWSGNGRFYKGIEIKYIRP
jgi:hypothetical protein